MMGPRSLSWHPRHAVHYLLHGWFTIVTWQYCFIFSCPPSSSWILALLCVATAVKAPRSQRYLYTCVYFDVLRTKAWELRRGACASFQSWCTFGQLSPLLRDRLVAFGYHTFIVLQNQRLQLWLRDIHLHWLNPSGKPTGRRTIRSRPQYDRQTRKKSMCWICFPTHLGLACMWGILKDTQVREHANTDSLIVIRLLSIASKVPFRFLIFPLRITH